MPTYEYECKKCGKKFEHSQPIEQWDQKQICPECQSQQTEKLVTSFIPKTSDKS